jgi:hypothetical protein
MRRTFSACGRLSWLGAIPLFVIGAAGCEERIYEIDLKPHGDTIERHLTLKRADLPNHMPKSLTADDRPEVERIARAYHAATPSLPRRDPAFSGVFGSVLPQDVGGDGHYVRYESPLGRVRIYVERFRGSDNLYASLESRRKAVDQVVDLIVGWLESELHGLPEWPKLRTFLDQQFRVDLQNLSLLVWSTNVRDIFESNDSLAEVAARAAQYLVERNYFSYEELPALRRETEDAMQRGNATSLLARISRFLAARVGGSEAHWKHAIAFLSDPTRTQASWHRFFWQSPYFKKHVADRKREPGQGVGSEPSAAAPTSPGSTSDAPNTKSILSAKFAEEGEADLLGNLFWSAFPPSSHILSDVSRVRATLEAPRKPFWTNGKWNEKDNRVEWSPLIAELPKPDRKKSPLWFEWPSLCFAAWDEPNEATQKQIFGRTGLTEAQLLDYCLWYQGLSGLEKKEWDAFLPALKDNQPAGRLKAFRFSNEPADRESYQTLASEVATTLTDVFYPKQSVERTPKGEPTPKAAAPPRR